MDGKRTQANKGKTALLKLKSSRETDRNPRYKHRGAGEGVESKAGEFYPLCDLEAPPHCGLGALSMVSLSGDHLAGIVSIHKPRQILQKFTECL